MGEKDRGSLGVAAALGERGVHELHEARGGLLLEVEAKSAQRLLLGAVGKRPVQADAHDGGREEGHPATLELAACDVIGKVYGPQAHGVFGDDAPVRQVQP